MGANGTTNTLLSLFTGAGGFDLGLEKAGFNIILCVENDTDARKTLALNRPRWPLAYPGNIYEVTPRQLLRQAGLRQRELTLLSAGPPCQPFSKSRYWANGDSPRLKDPRAKTLRAFLDVVEMALPKIIILENVKGIAFNGKDEGLITLNTGLRKINAKKHTKYKPQIVSLNAADFGVPQLRERIFIIASRDGASFSCPEPTHGVNLKYRYLTAWDSIGDLDIPSWPEDLTPGGRWAALLPSIPEGQNYQWHTPRNSAPGAQPIFGWRTRFWSFLLKLSKSKPSWTIQANPGPATGPFHWRNRLLSIKEMCRLQTFPDEYQIVGSRRSAHRQIGNAVPSAIGELLGLEMRRQFFDERVRRKLRLIPTPRNDCPNPEKTGRVPRAYLPFRADHPDHPGTGLGPAAIRRGK